MYTNIQRVDFVLRESETYDNKLSSDTNGTCIQNYTRRIAGEIPGAMHAYSTNFRSAMVYRRLFYHIGAIHSRCFLRSVRRNDLHRSVTKHSRRPSSVDIAVYVT